MTVRFEVRGRIDARGRITIPKSVRKALGIGPGDKIAFMVSDRGVTIEPVGHDPVIASFLEARARDAQREPSANVIPFPKISSGG